MGMNVVSFTHMRFTLLLLTTVYSVLCLVAYKYSWFVLEL
jgi:hypothetical protein